MSQDALMQALAFTADDLAMNRAGQISPEQRLRLGSSGWKITLAYSLLALILAIFAVGPALRVAQTDPTIRDFKDVLIMTLFAGLALIPATLAFRRWRKVMADTVGRTIKSVRGTVVIEKQSSSKRRIISINNVVFPINDDVTKAFSTGIDYVIYYAPNTMTMLSAEMVFMPK